MRRILGTFALLGAGVLAATQPTLAQTTQNDIPPPPSVPPTGPVGGDSNLILSVWSQDGPQSLVYNTGLLYSQVQLGDITPDGGLVLDFGTIPNWSAVNGITDLQYHVVALDGSGTNAQRGVATTGALGSAPFTGTNGDVSSITGSAAGAAFFAQFATQCPSLNPCTNTQGLDAQDPLHWDANLGGYLDVNASTNVGSPLGFYLMTGVTGATSVAATVQRYENSAHNLGTWLLTAQGHLTYTIAGTGEVVPLPAAVWLLMSGLAGMGFVARRRNVA